MAVGRIDTEHLTDIANAIRQQNGTSTLYKPSEMAQAVLDLDGTSAGSPGTEPYKTVTSGIVSRRHIQAIADAIRTQNGQSIAYRPEDMAQAILDLSWGELKPRALLLTDGTLEFTYLSSAASPSGGTVASAFDVDPDGYSSAGARPWDAVRTSITAARFDVSWADAGFANGSWLLNTCTGLAAVYGFENCQGLITATQMFSGCPELESIFASEYDSSTITSGSYMFGQDTRLVGGDGTTPTTTSTGAALCHLGAGGVLTDPDDDQREWVWGHLYDDGELSVTTDATPDASRTLVSSGRVCAGGKYAGVEAMPWAASRASMTSASFAEDVSTLALLNMNYWFYNATALTAVSGLANVAHAGSLRYAFSGCTSLESIDLCGLDPSEVTSVYYLFGGCSALTAIYADSDWELPSLSSAALAGTFYGCTALVGGSGTAWSSANIKGDYLRIDVSEAPGYMTAKTVARALLLSDGTLEFTYLSSAASPSEGTVEHAYILPAAGYASADERPWHGIRTTITAARFDESFASCGITNAAYLLNRCSSMKTVYGFENFQGIVDASYMFTSCTALESIYASEYDNSTITASAVMFGACSHLVGADGTSCLAAGTPGDHCILGAGGILTDPDDDPREWVWGHLYAGGVLVITADPSPDASRELVSSGRVCAGIKSGMGSGLPWYGHMASVTSAVFATDISSLTLLNMSGWFQYATGLTSVLGLENVAHSGAMRHMFAGCTALESIDLCRFDPSGITDLFCTFSGCTALTAIYADPDWELPSLGVEQIGGTFDGCTALVGGNGTAWSSEHDDGDYLVIDRRGTLGYMTWRSYTKEPRALLLDDGTMELTYLSAAYSPSGGTVSQAFSASKGGYSSAASRPWHSVASSVTAVRVDSSFAAAGITDMSYWFDSFTSLIEVRGFEHLNGIVKATCMFNNCMDLESIYATSFDSSTITAYTDMLNFCCTLVGIDGASPYEDSGYLSLLHVGAGGVLVDPDGDTRRYFYVHAYADGGEVVSSSATPDPSRELLHTARRCTIARYHGYGNLHPLDYRDTIVSAAISADMAGMGVVDMTFLFNRLSNLKTVTGLGLLDGIGDALHMFSHCGMEVVDLRGVDASAFTSIYCMFMVSTQLTTILCDADFALPEDVRTSASKNAMTFDTCEALVGGNGTEYSEDHENGEYMRPDISGQRGYLTVA